MKRRVVVIASILSMLLVTTACFAGPFSGAGPISATQNWKGYEIGTKNGTGKTFRVSNYEKYGDYNRTDFQVRASMGGIKIDTTVWVGMVYKNSVLKTFSMSNTVDNGKDIRLRYKIPDGLSATSDSAYIEYYWF